MKIEQSTAKRAIENDAEQNHRKHQKEVERLTTELEAQNQEIKFKIDARIEDINAMDQVKEMDKMDIWGITKARAERKRIEEALQEATTAFDNSQPPPQPEEVTIVFQDDDNSVCSWANSDPDDSAANANAENSTSNTTAKSDNKTLTTDNYYDRLSPINNEEERSPNSTNDEMVQESTNPVQAPQQPAYKLPPATSRRKTKWAQEPTEGHILFDPQVHSARQHGRRPPTNCQKQGQ